MINIVIPASGLGSRFTAAKYSEPKPFIDVNGEPMICAVTRNIRPKYIEHRVIWLVKSEHILRADQLAKEFNAICVPVFETTAGAACTVMLASKYIDNNEGLLIANSDQIVDVSMDNFIVASENSDGSIMVFPATENKWSYARLDKDGLMVEEVAEKIVISPYATVGIYYFEEGGYFIRAAKRMIRKDIRFRNEFYVAPVFNELILENMSVRAYHVDAKRVHGLGTPEDLERYVSQPRV
jgi:dTDP-glucose pyrophosphorylase